MRQLSTSYQRLFGKALWQRPRQPGGLLLLAGLLLFTGLSTSSPVTAATLPAGFTESVLATGLTNPTAMAFAPDGRLFVCQQGGQLRVIKNGSLLATPFVTVTTDSAGERGLLGIAFDPNFTSNQFLYVYYTATTPAIHNRVSRFTANGDVATAGSELPIFDLNDLSGATNHNGGAIHFDPDGKLYIAAGENANAANSQSIGNLLGKILRINFDVQFRRIIQPPFPGSSALQPVTTARSGQSDCAIPTSSRFSRAPGECSSTTSARAPGKRSTTASPARTTDGPSAKDFAHRPMQSFEILYLSMATGVHRRLAARLPAGLSIAPRRHSSRAITWGGNFQDAEMVKAFLTSIEYRGRFPR